MNLETLYKSDFNNYVKYSCSHFKIHWQEAEDLCQSTFIKLIEHYGPLQEFEEAPLRTMIAKSLRNVLADNLKEQTRMEMLLSEFDVNEHYIDPLILEAFFLLAGRGSELLSDYYVHNMRHFQLEKKYKLTKAAVRGRLKRLTERLKNNLQLVEPMLRLINKRG